MLHCSTEPCIADIYINNFLWQIKAMPPQVKIDFILLQNCEAVVGADTSIFSTATHCNGDATH